MKVWIVNSISYSPAYSSDGPSVIESQSIEGVFANKAKGQECIDRYTSKSGSVWATDYEFEDADGTDVIQ